MNYNVNKCTLLLYVFPESDQPAHLRTQITFRSASPHTQTDLSQLSQRIYIHRSVSAPRTLISQTIHHIHAQRSVRSTSTSVHADQQNTHTQWQHSRITQHTRAYRLVRSTREHSRRQITVKSASISTYWDQSDQQEHLRRQITVRSANTHTHHSQIS